MICPNCKHNNHKLAGFCSSCGQSLTKVKSINYNIPIRNILLFFFSLTAYIFAIKFTNLGQEYETLLLIDLIFAAIVILFFAFNFKSTIRLFHFKKNSLHIIIQVLIGSIGLAICVYFLADFLNKNLFDSTEITYYEQFKNSPFPLLFSILSIGLFPAVFEEIAFRGVLYNQCLKIMSLKQTIFVTSILFTILHLSLLSILWLFPGALLLGYLRAKKRSLLYGMIAHFSYNTAIVLLQVILQ